MRARRKLAMLGGFDRSGSAAVCAFLLAVSFGGGCVQVRRGQGVVGEGVAGAAEASSGPTPETLRAEEVGHQAEARSGDGAALEASQSAVYGDLSFHVAWETDDPRAWLIVWNGTEREQEFCYLRLTVYADDKSKPRSRRILCDYRATHGPADCFRLEELQGVATPLLLARPGEAVTAMIEITIWDPLQRSCTTLRLGPFTSRRPESHRAIRFGPEYLDVGGDHAGASSTHGEPQEETPEPEEPLCGTEGDP